MPKATWGNIEGNPFEDDLEDYDVYDGEQPPKGVYRCTLKFLRLKENSNGDPMLNGLLVINEPKGSKKSQFNGYDFWFNQNVTKQGAPYVNNFLAALVPEDKVAALRKAFWGQKVMLDKNEPPNVVSIGTLKLLDKTPLVSVNTKNKLYNGETSLDVSKFMRPKDDEVGDAPADDEEEWAEDEDEGDEEIDDSDAAEGDEDEELAEREEELSEMSLAELKKIARGELGMKLAEVKNLDEDGLIEAILEREFPEGDSDEEPEPEEDEEPEEEEADDEEEEEEPEPPKRTRRSAAKAAPAPAPTSRRRSAAPATEEAPARTRTGTRRRKASGEPPF